MQRKGIIATVERVATACFGVYLLLYLGGIFDSLRINIYSGSHTALVVTFILTLTFLRFPAIRGARRRGIPWYDVLAIILSLITFLYMAINQKDIVVAQAAPNDYQKVLGVVAVILVLEAVRRAVHPVLSALGLFFFVYPLFSDKLGMFLEGPAYSLDRIISVQYLYPYGMLGTITNLLATIIIAFILFGAFLEASGSGQRLINIAMAVAGRFRGGPAKVAVIGSALFGMVNGSAMANVATTGVITIPLMKKIGYKPTFAGAVEAVASTAGPMTPPVMGAVIFLMMDFLGVSYARMMVVAALPIALYFLGLFLMVDFEAVKLKLRGLPPEQLPPLKHALRDSWTFAIPIAVLLYFLVWLDFAVATSAIYGTASLVLVSFFTRKTRMGPKKLLAALEGYSRGLPEVGTVLVSAGLITGAFSLTGLGLRLATGLVAMSGGNLFILVLLTGMTCLVLGMGLSGIAVYMLTAIFLAPALVIMGVPPVAAHFFVLYLSHAALITPPVSAVAFMAATIAGAPLMATGWQACRLGIVIYLIPFAFIYDPALLMVGSPERIALASISALAGVFLLTAGVSGRLLMPANWIERALFLAGGVLLLTPAWQTKLIGVIIGIALVLWQLRVRISESGHTVKTS